MSWWPEDYEPLREEARVVSRAAAEAFAQRMAGLDDHARLVAGREMIASMYQDGAGGRDEDVAGVTCRVFDPAGTDRVGTYLAIHGGALMWGSPRMNDVQNAELAERHRVRVVSPDYRLAPEHPHPAAPDDCLAVAQWVLEHEPGIIVVGGESAGGHLAVVTLLHLRDELDAIERVAGTNLVYGVFDLSGTPSARGSRPSDIPDILEGNGQHVRDAYLPGRTIEDARDPAISPLYAELHDLPPALFTVGTGDRLLDDSLFMAARWQAFGNETELAVFPDCPHGFTNFPIALAKHAHERIDRFLARAFAAR